jgi:hypothetical protein
MEVRDLSSVDALLEEVNQEAREPTRFPARPILLTGVDDWCQVIEGLSRNCEVVRLSALCRDGRVPSIFDVTSRLAQLSDRPALLVPLGELLRLLPASQAAYLDFLLSLDRPGRERLYIPVLDSGGLIHAQMDRHHHYTAYSPPVWRLHGAGSARIDFAPFAIKTERSETLCGIETYLRAWEHASLESALVVTPLAKDLAESDGVVSTRVYRTAFDVVHSYLVEGETLTPDMGTIQQWRWLAGEVSRGDSLSVLASRLLNVRGYNERQLYAVWQNRSDNERWLTWLWSQHGAGARTLSERLARLATKPSDMGRLAAMLPLDADLSLADITARRQLLVDLGVAEMPGQFWDNLRRLAEPLRRLKCLPGLGPTCREQIVRETGALLEQGVPLDAWLPVLRVTYPELAAYLTPPPVSDEPLQTYLREYTHARVRDEATKELRGAVEAWARGRHVWDSRTRSALLSEIGANDDCIVWIDALGVEWLGMLYELLSSRNLVVEPSYGRCNLPSITSANADWQQGRDVDRDLDQLAHSYSYSFPRTFVRQIEFIARLADRVATLCDASKAVILTSDHGLTRFAASGEQVDLPPGYRSHKWGRHAEPDTPDVAEVPSGAWLVDGNCLLLASHGLFRGGSRTVGEVHGGATPEESLVPVLRICSRGVQALPAFAIPEPIVRVDAAGRGQLTVAVRGQVTDLRIVVGAISVPGSPGDTSAWTFVLRGMSPGSHTVHVYCTLGYLGAAEIEVVRGIQQRDLGL